MSGSVLRPEASENEAAGSELRVRRRSKKVILKL